jgi:hypothetical protein
MMLPLYLFEGKLSLVVVSEVIQRTELRRQAILGRPLVIHLAHARRHLRLSIRVGNIANKASCTPGPQVKKLQVTQDNDE